MGMKFRFVSAVVFVGVFLFIVGSLVSAGYEARHGGRNVFDVIYSEPVDYDSDFFEVGDYYWMDEYYLANYEDDIRRAFDFDRRGGDSGRYRYDSVRSRYDEDVGRDVYRTGSVLLDNTIGVGGRYGRDAGRYDDGSSMRGRDSRERYGRGSGDDYGMRGTDDEYDGDYYVYYSRTYGTSYRIRCHESAPDDSIVYISC